MSKRFGIGLGAVVFALGLASAQAAPPAASDAAASTTSIPMTKDGGVYVVPVLINGEVTIDCIVDSGAADVNIPEGVYRKLLRSGSLKKSDYVGERVYILADGSEQKARLYHIATLKIGDVIVRDIIVSVGGDKESGLLGQGFFERFRSWSLDNTTHALVLTGTPAGPAPFRVAGDPESGTSLDDGEDAAIAHTTSESLGHHGGTHAAAPAASPTGTGNVSDEGRHGGH